MNESKLLFLMPKYIFYEKKNTFVIILILITQWAKISNNADSDAWRVCF